MKKFNHVNKYFSLFLLSLIVFSNFSFVANLPIFENEHFCHVLQISHTIPTCVVGKNSQAIVPANIKNNSLTVFSSITAQVIEPVFTSAVSINNKSPPANLS